MPLPSMSEPNAVEPSLRQALDKIDRQTVMLVACIPIFFTPVAIALGLSGWGMTDPSQARLHAPTGMLIIAQGLVCMALAYAGRLRLAMAVAVTMSLLVVLHSSLWVGLGLRTPSFTALATVCFLSAYLFGSRVANAIAFISLAMTLIIAMMVMINPQFMAEAPAITVQPTAMLLSHLGLFINTQIICGAYSRKKALLLNHLNQQTQELETVLEKRRQALRERQNLLGQIAHNLRTPLATVVSSLQLMERTAGQPERQQRYAGNLRNASEKILWQTQQFSTYECIHEGHVPVSREPVDLSSTLQSLIDAYCALPQCRNVQIRLHVRNHVHARLQVDREHFSTMLRNLVDNALKYVQEGQIDITVDEMSSPNGDNLLSVKVEDNGPGLAAAVAADLFKPFVQGAENPANALEGSGLGLYITRGLARAMGGDAGAENRPEGGCRSWFTLQAPLAPTTIRHAA